MVIWEQYKKKKTPGQILYKYVLTYDKSNTAAYKNCYLMTKWGLSQEYKWS